jgi:hypothetical protein
LKAKKVRRVGEQEDRQMNWYANKKESRRETNSLTNSKTAWWQGRLTDRCTEKTIWQTEERQTGRKSSRHTVWLRVRQLDDQACRQNREEPEKTFWQTEERQTGRKSGRQTVN